jgi:hypothetical protein
VEIIMIIKICVRWGSNSTPAGVGSHFWWCFCYNNAIPSGFGHLSLVIGHSSFVIRHWEVVVSNSHVHLFAHSPILLFTASPVLPFLCLKS